MAKNQQRYGDQLNPLDTPEFVVVGHVCLDLQPDGSLTLGGSVSYAATAALRMGCRVGIVTSAGPDLDFAEAFPGAQVVCHRAAETTVFENIYHDGERTQIIHQRADVITCDDIPLAWRNAPMVYLGTIDQEIDLSVFHCFADESLICVMPQGFFRCWDEAGRVYFVEWDPPEAVLRRINVLVLSELDVGDPDQLVCDWGPLIEIIVITHAERGATVYEGSEQCRYPTRPANEVDLTGAGDVFAAVFLICLYELGNPCEAMRSANVAASFSVEGHGLAGIPHRKRVAAYLQRVTDQPPSAF
jgi:sugar/nucleoside kinase (ribokinase family)